MQLAELTWTDADRGAADVVLLPVGSTEQHGPHAPLGTDTLLAEAVARRGADRSPREVLVAPTLPFGVAEEHRNFAGTLWLSPGTFRAAIRETVESLAYHGWEAVVAVNGHGGNVDALREACARLTRDGTASCVAFTWFDAIDLSKSDLGHGGSVETSSVLAERPELVHPDRFDEASAGSADRWGSYVRGVNVAYDTDEFSDNGVVGDPSDATAERGEALLAEAGDALVDVIEATVERA